MTYINQTADGVHATDNRRAILLLDDNLCRAISRFNGYLSCSEVRHALESGKTLYTAFSKYRRLNVM